MTHEELMRELNRILGLIFEAEKPEKTKGGGKH